MDTKNVIAAISLSAAVIIIYSLFFQPDPANIKKNLAEQNKIEQTGDAPSLDQNENIVEVSREEALAESDRVEFENDIGLTIAPFRRLKPHRRLRRK